MRIGFLDINDIACYHVCGNASKIFLYSKNDVVHVYGKDMFDIEYIGGIMKAYNIEQLP